MSETTYFFDSRLAKTNPIDYVKDKEKSCNSFIRYMTLRLTKMFKYTGLPDTIPKEMLEMYLMHNGNCYITKVNGELYALIGSYGGEPDPYYRPTLYIVANPGLKLSETYKLWEDGVLMRNDPAWYGLYPLMSRYASMLAENFLTMRSADIMLRVMAMFTAPDDKTKIAAEEYLKKLEKGEFGVIGENRFFDEGVKMQSPPSNNGSYLTQFIELHQYLTGTFYNEVGLNANFNMKREAIGDGESSLNEDSLLPLCELMLETRKEDVEKINKMFGTEITVEFDSAWLNNKKEIALEFDKLEKEASQLAEETNEDNSGDSSGSIGDDSIESEDGNTDEVDSDEDNGLADSDAEPEGETDGNVDEVGDSNDDSGTAGNDEESENEDPELEDEEEEEDDGNSEEDK